MACDNGNGNDDNGDANAVDDDDAGDLWICLVSVLRSSLAYACYHAKKARWNTRDNWLQVFTYIYKTAAWAIQLQPNVIVHFH